MSSFTERLLHHVRTEIAIGDVDGLDADTDLLLTGLVDSLGVVQLVEWLEAEAGVIIEPGDVTLENFQTVGLMVRFVDSLREAAG